LRVCEGTDEQSDAPDYAESRCPTQKHDEPQLALVIMP
jgi:hypothetical protein